MLGANIKNEIISTYSQAKRGRGNEVELEARFGHFSRNGFIPGVPFSTFSRIKEYFSSRIPEGRGRFETKTTDYTMGQVRKSVSNPLAEDKIIISWISKNKLWNRDLPEYNIRYSMSQETQVSAIPDNLFKPDIVREKNRISFILFENAIRLDLTQVNMMSDLQKQKLKQKEEDKTTYEVEIELINSQRLDVFEKAVIAIAKLVLDTPILYSNEEKYKIIGFTNYLLGSQERRYLDHSILVQARNLKLRDMVWGGLIGNAKTGYSVTHKADGQRRLLVFHDRGIWLLGSNVCTKVSDRKIPTLIGSILDGELIPMEQRYIDKGAPSIPFWFLVFDCLAWSRDAGIQKLSHFKRMGYGQAVADTLKDMADLTENILRVDTKSFRVFNTPQEFFALMREMYREQLHLIYKNDGFMFTPTDTEYNPHSDRLPVFKRILTEAPDICKWKPKEELTIDFQIKWEADASSPIGRSISLYVSDRGQPVLFSFSGFDSNKIDHLNPLTLNLPSGTVVEYEYNYERDILVPKRVRFDKPKGNGIEIAKNIWEDIQNPIEVNTMQGDSLILLRRYHNRIKRELFNSVNPKGRTLLDIGSGAGGDLRKWSGFDRIVAVEPNAENLKEFYRRLEESDIKDRVKVIQCGGEETEKIVAAVNEWLGGKADVISSMLSLTFFWKSEHMVNALCNTILQNLKPAGKFIFLTMDGTLVEQTFDPPLKNGYPLKRIDLGNVATLEYFGDRNPKELYIDIKGSIVTQQQEWLVYIDDLILKLGKFGVELSRREKADQEKFLTEEEILLTQMYTFATFSATPSFVPPISTPFPLPSLPSSVSSLPSSVSLPKLEESSHENLTITADANPKTEMEPISSLAPMEEEEIEEAKDEILAEISKQEDPALLDEGEKKSLPILLPSLSLPKIDTQTHLAKIEIQETKEKKEKKTTKPKEKALPSLEMDQVEELKVSWLNKDKEKEIGKIYRIGAIGDNHCFFHSTLNAYLKYYQNNPDVAFRKKFVRGLRSDLALMLELPNPNYLDKEKTKETKETKTWYETASNGHFLDLYEQQKEGLEMIDDYGVKLDFSLEGLKKFFASDQFIGDETFGYFADIIDIDIYITRATKDDLILHVNTSLPGRERRGIVICGNGCHYETVAIKTSEGYYQTLFPYDHPLLIHLRRV